MLKLPDVTLVLVDTIEHELARLAVGECLAKVEFGDVVLGTDKLEAFDGLPGRHVYVPNYPTKTDWCRYVWFSLPPLVRTSHALLIQWDSWVWDTSQWTNDYLAYDYIGSPWWYKDGLNVGNSGFALKSSRLMRYVRDRAAKFPCDTGIEDDLLCRTYRPALEDAGLSWAPEELAHRFAFECCRPSPTSRHFGFHAPFNFGEVLDRPALLERARLILGSSHVGHPESYVLKQFCERYPDVVEEVLSEREGLAVAPSPWP